MKTEQQDEAEINRLMRQHVIHNPKTFIPSFRKGDKVKHIRYDEIYILEEDSFLNCDRMELVRLHSAPSIATFIQKV